MEFIIPSSKDDLLSRRDARHYIVEEILTIRQVSPALEAYKSVCKKNPRAVKEHFDTLFSILCLQKDLDITLLADTWSYLYDGCQTFWRELSSLLDESDLSRECRQDNLNTLKMTCYLLCQFMELFETIDTKPSTTVTVKGKGKKAKSTTLPIDWTVEKQNGLQLILDFVTLTLLKLWDPPIAEEEFVSLLSGCCCKLLENPTISKAKDSIVVIGHIFGHLVQRYNHGLSISLKIDQLLKHFEFLSSPMAHIVEIMVNDHRCKSTIADLFREIGSTDNKETAKDSTAAKSYSGFMVELAEKMPAVLPYMPIVIGLLDEESYTLRNGVLGMLGEILVRYLSKDNLDDKMRSTRDMFFDKLEAHILDVNAFVRSKVLQIWQNIIAQRCLPLLRQESLMTCVVDRLGDKSSIVRRNALQLVTELLKSNPFAAKLPAEDLKINYEKEKAILDQMAPEMVVPAVSPEVDKRVSDNWKIFEEKLSRVLATEAVMSADQDLSTLISEGESSDNVLSEIVKLLEEDKLKDAVMLTYAAMESFPDVPVFSVHNTADQSMEDEAADSRGRVNVISAVKEIYFWVKCPMITQTVENKDDDVHSDLIKQQTLVQYLKNSLTFALQVQQCIPVICQLLGSKNTTDVLEAIQFFVTAVEFGVSAASMGARKMMVLIWSQEAAVKEAVVNAYRKIYLEPKEGSQKNFAGTVVKNLSSLLVGLTYGDLMSLEALISEFVKSGHIGAPVFKVLWNEFIMKSEGVTALESRCAIHLIAMCAEAEHEIVRSNVEVLVQEGLGPRGEMDYMLAQGTCLALLKLVPVSKEKGKLPSDPIRFETDHSMFQRLKSILLNGVTNMKSHQWIPLAEQAIAVIYKLCDSPAINCADLLKQLLVILKQTCENESQLQRDSGDVSEDSVKSSLVSCVLARVLSVAGLVAFRQTVFMEVDILTEMKRLLAVEENKKGRRKSKGGDASKASELEEDMALAGASAEDTEAEYIKKLCELELLAVDNLLVKFCPLILAVCSNSARFPDLNLQKEASLALARYMIVNPTFCDAHLQLLFTLLEKSPSPIIRSNLIIALGDLTFRFPNLIAPWTSHLYSRLRDSCSAVRKTTLQVLTHLILNDMVKVKGQISELAICIVDPDDKISGLAKLFFLELAKKTNSMYNMPDIISRLSDPDVGVEENHFHIIIRYIFSNIEKSKHCESLVEKLCLRFRGTRTDRQVHDLSFCLSQLTYSEKALAKLMEHFPCFADKLVDPVVYNHFVQIISKSRQFIRQETKMNLEELENKIEQAHTKGFDGASGTNQVAASVCAKGKTARGKAAKGRGKSMAVKNVEDNEEEVNDENSPLKPRRGKKASKQRYTIDSEDDDDEFFEFGKEGKKDRNLDDDDSLIIKPSQRKAKRGKVALTPTFSPSI